MWLEFLDNFKDISFTFRITLSILSVGTFITSLEDLRSWSVFQSNGILSWKVSKLGIRWFVKSIFSKPLDFLMQDKVYKSFIYIRIFSSLLILIYSIYNVISTTLVFFLFFSSMANSLRSPYGLNGAHQMYLVILFALSVGTFFEIGTSISVLCLWFITVQLLLAYFISGITKLASPMWRTSLALNAIFSTRCYGHSLLYQLFSKRKTLTVFVSWFIFSFEILFFTLFFFSPNYAILFVISGLLFHLSNAVFMGLNDFLFAFSACYPALIYCVYHAHLKF